MTTTTITIIAIATFALGFTTCYAQNKSTAQSKTVIKKVAYADKILQHMHPEKVLNYLPDLKDEQLAYLYGMSLQEYESAKQEYADQAKEAALSLSVDADFARKIKELPFKKDDIILVIGESTADALNSWVYMLQDLLNEKRPEDQIKVINAAISGQTTSEALRRITGQIKLKPDWVICHLGANDCMRYGDETNKTTVRVSESIANLETIQKIVEAQSDAQFVWMTPATINEEKVSAFPPFRKMQIHLNNADILTIADSLKMKPGLVIDLVEGFGVPAQSEYVQFDGVHLSIAGQKRIVQTLINTFSTDLF